MRLYHYSKDLYSQLKTRAKSGGMSLNEITQARQKANSKPWFDLPYCDHISFFFEPIPSELLSKIYPKDHHTWVQGNELYEYAIEVDQLPNVLQYQVVESPKLLEIYDKFSKDNNWVTKDPVLLEKWMKIENQKMRELHYYGNSLVELKRVIPQFDKGIEGFYKIASKREDFEDNKYKYAACVPHLMLYPPSGTVEISSISKVVIGYSARFPVNKIVVPAWTR